MQVISIKSWNDTEFYYNWDKSKFFSFEDADLSNANFHCDESDIENAKECAEREGLNPDKVKLEILDLDEQ